MSIFDVKLRPIGKTNIRVSPVALGCWPIAGMTSLDVNDADSLETLSRCFEVGINFLDTAYCYGIDGLSERLIARAVGDRRDEMVISTKGGIHWDPAGQRVFDARPQTLRRQCEQSLRRLNTDRVELLYLHAPDPNVPVTESAGALKELLTEGKARAIGVSNMNLQQLETFQEECPVSAYQPHYNMLQREIERDTLPWCRQYGVSVMVYWPLMMGLLAGSLRPDHIFMSGDGRAKYPQFQSDEYQKNLDLVDRLRAIAADAGRSVAQLVVNWTMHQPGIAAALCGAKRPAQVADNAGAMGWQLTAPELARIDAALAERGTPVVRVPTPEFSARAR